MAFTLTVGSRAGCFLAIRKMLLNMLSKISLGSSAPDECWDAVIMKAPLKRQDNRALRMKLQMRGAKVGSSGWRILLLIILMRG